MTVTDVRLIAPEDNGYRAFVQRKIQERMLREPAGLDCRFSPTPGTARKGEPSTGASARSRSVGKQVERAVRRWLGECKKLERDRILTWRQGTRTLRERRYAELDAVHRVDYDTLVVYEVKFLSAEPMLSCAGLAQLDRAANLLQSTPAGRRVRKRLIYIGDGSIQIPNVPEVTVEDTMTPLGVLWVTPEIVSSMAQDLGVPLEGDWHIRRAAPGLHIRLDSFSVVCPPPLSRREIPLQAVA